MFQKATKRNARLRLAVAGPAGTGKTYSILRLAHALIGRPETFRPNPDEQDGEIAFIDTEHGSASKYADIFGFDVHEPAKFDPRDLVKSIRTAVEGQYKVIIIDSLSHYWMGPGGELELVDQAAKRIKDNTWAAWKTVTPYHNELVDTILSAKIHVLASMRTKTEWVTEKDQNGKNTPRKLGLQPIMRDGIEFEFDVMGDLDQENTLTVTKSRCSALSGAVINRPGPEMAKVLIAWLTDGAPEIEKPQPQPVAEVKPENKRGPSEQFEAERQRHEAAKKGTGDRFKLFAEMKERIGPLAYRELLVVHANVQEAEHIGSLEKSREVYKHMMEHAQALEKIADLRNTIGADTTNRILGANGYETMYVITDTQKAYAVIRELQAELVTEGAA